MDFDPFCEIVHSKEGLLHGSEAGHERDESPGDGLKEGEAVEIRFISADREGKTRLSRRELLPFPEGAEADAARERIQRAREAGPPSPARGGYTHRSGQTRGLE